MSFTPRERVLKPVMRTDSTPPEKHGSKPLELNFFLRRAKGAGVFVVGADSLTDSIVVIGPTLRDLRKALAERIAAQYGPDVSIRLYVGHQPIPSAADGIPQAMPRSRSQGFDGARS